MTKITGNMGNIYNLRKSYCQYQSYPKMFATTRPDLVVGRAVAEEIKKKKINKQKKSK